MQLSDPAVNKKSSVATHQNVGHIHSILFQYFVKIYDKAAFPFFTRGQFWPSGIVIACVCGSVCQCVCVCQSRACPHDNSSLIQATITKFRPQMQKHLVLGSYCFGEWSMLTFKAKFYFKVEFYPILSFSTP